ncbi:hypothetical protein HanIR_Chr02g0085401 [Helianthus annuus]|nr:hypothetical protein HanIR_Chr02g0085401 [Helianthus annuus]
MIFVTIVGEKKNLKHCKPSDVGTKGDGVSTERCRLTEVELDVAGDEKVYGFFCC